MTVLLLTDLPNLLLLQMQVEMHGGHVCSKKRKLEEVITFLSQRSNTHKSEAILVDGSTSVKHRHPSASDKKRSRKYVTNTDTEESCHSLLESFNALSDVDKSLCRECIVLLRVMTFEGAPYDLGNTQTVRRVSVPWINQIYGVLNHTKRKMDPRAINCIVDRVMRDAEYRQVLKDKFTGECINDVVFRSVDFFIDSIGKFEGVCRQVRRKMEFLHQGPGDICRHLTIHDGFDMFLPWPPRKRLQIVTASSHVFDHVCDTLLREYDLPAGWMVPFGLILHSNEKMSPSKTVAALLLLQCGWILLFDARYGDPRVFIAAESAEVFSRDGLCRCDTLYKDFDTPFATVVDSSLKKLISHGMTLPLLLKLRLELTGCKWLINGCPGRMSDRIFTVGGYELDDLCVDGFLSFRGVPMYVFGFISTFTDESAETSQLFICVDANLQIIGYNRQFKQSWYLADNFLHFFKIATRKRYFDFEIYSKKQYAEHSDLFNIIKFIRSDCPDTNS